MPTRPDHVDEKIKGYIKNKVPHFFINAKDKEEHSVEKLNLSTVNRLEKVIPSERINFKSVAGCFDYRTLLNNKNARLDQSIIKEYTRLDRNKKWLMNSDEGVKQGQKLYVYKIIKDRLMEIHCNEKYIVDVLVKHLYMKKSKFKTTLWECFGETILSNIRRNVYNEIVCIECRKIVKNPKQRQIRCETCQKKHKQYLDRLRKKRNSA
ncbi:hypothetical protein [Bacillus velezensis]